MFVKPRLLAYHYGTEIPEHSAALKSADDIRLTVNDYEDRIHQDEGPNSTCKYLAIEEMRCLHENQFQVESERAATQCFKWYDEHQKCLWDDFKFNEGLTHLEGPQIRRSRAYIFSPAYLQA